MAKCKYDQSGRGKYYEGESGRERHMENSTTNHVSFTWTPGLVDLWLMKFIQAL